MEIMRLFSIFSVFVFHTLFLNFFLTLSISADGELASQTNGSSEVEREHELLFGHSSCFYSVVHFSFPITSHSGCCFQ